MLSPEIFPNVNRVKNKSSGACGMNNTDINTRIGWYAKNVPDGTTAEEFLDLMILRRNGDGGTEPKFRYARPEDVASVAAWLLGSESDWVTGQVFGVDGGLGTLRVTASSGSPACRWAATRSPRCRKWAGFRPPTVPVRW